MSSMFYGTQVWDPVLIVAQIVTIQCLFYISFGLLLWILVGKLNYEQQAAVSSSQTAFEQ